MSEPKSPHPSPVPADPPRLADEEGTAAKLLRDADDEYRGGLDQRRAWRRLKQPRARGVSPLAAAGAAAAVVLLAYGLNYAERTRAEGPERELTKEPMGPTLAAVRAQDAAPAASVAESAEAARLELGSDSPSEESGRPQPSSRRTAPQPDGTGLPSAAASGGVPSDAECRQRAAASAEDGAVCYALVARGSDLGGEVALFELSRLHLERLQNAARALDLADEHRRRFPNGALRAEAEWVAVRAAFELGKDAQALARSEALLAAPWGRALAAELHWLRGRIYEERQNDCARAVTEYVALVGETSARADAAELRRARCLETLGRHGDAVSAYTRYLSRAEPRQAAEAQRRLDSLKKGEEGHERNGHE